MGDLPERIETERLVLRLFETADVPRLAALIGVWPVARWLVRVPHPYTEQDGHAWVELSREARNNGAALNFAIQPRGDRSLIGGIGLIFADGELGYWLGEAYWGQGYGREAAQAMVDSGFGQLGVPRICARVHPENTRSEKVLMAAGLVFEGERDVDYELRGGLRQARAYAQTVEGWRSRR